MGRSKRFLIRKRQKRRSERAREKVKLHRLGQLKPAELNRLARKLVAKRQRMQARSTSS